MVASTAVHACWRRARICGGLGVAAVFANSVPAPGLHMTASTKPFSMMSSIDTAIKVVSITNANLSNMRLKMVWFVLILEWSKKYLDFIVEGGWYLTIYLVSFL